MQPRACAAATDEQWRKIVHNEEDNVMTLS